MRLIVMGNRILTDGFALLGFETFPDATVEIVEEILSDLLKKREKALVFLENELSHSVPSRFRLGTGDTMPPNRHQPVSTTTVQPNSPSDQEPSTTLDKFSSTTLHHPTSILLCARCEAAGIIITEIPPLNAPDSYRPAVEDLIIRILGISALSNV